MQRNRIANIILGLMLVGATLWETFLSHTHHRLFAAAFFAFMAVLCFLDVLPLTKYFKAKRKPEHYQF